MRLKLFYNFIHSIRFVVELFRFKKIINLNSSLILNYYPRFKRNNKNAHLIFHQLFEV